MGVSDSRRRWRARANARGITVRGLNGEVRKGVILGRPGSNWTYNDLVRPKLYVDDPFAPISFPIKWELVKAIAEGYLTEIVVHRNNEVTKALEARAAG
jgi:hypothetical protein